MQTYDPSTQQIATTSRISKNQLEATKNRLSLIPQTLSILTTPVNNSPGEIQIYNDGEMEVENLKQFQAAQMRFNERIFYGVSNLMGITKFHNGEIVKNQEMITALDNNQEAIVQTILKHQYRLEELPNYISQI